MAKSSRVKVKFAKIVSFDQCELSYVISIPIFIEFSMQASILKIERFIKQPVCLIIVTKQFRCSIAFIQDESCIVSYTEDKEIVPFERKSKVWR